MTEREHMGEVRGVERASASSPAASEGAKKKQLRGVAHRDDEAGKTYPSETHKQQDEDENA